MYRSLLLLLVWAWPTQGCETGVAFADQSLSLYLSSLANADVALLKSYRAADTNACLNDCCTEKYGSCSVASFKRDNATGADNCHLFNCRPVQKCKFVSSNSTDSFSFSSSTEPRVSVPSRQHASNISSTPTVSSTFTPELDGPPALKNDNTTVKPRKGVVGNLKDIFGNEERSGVKPRKGVSLEGGGSKVKPRKGVGPQQPVSSISPSERNESIPSQSSKVYQDVVAADDLVSALERVFEDDVRDRPLMTSSKPFWVDTFPKTSMTTILPTSSSAYFRDVIPTSLITQSSSSSVVDTTTTSGLLLPSLTTTSQLVSKSTVSTVRTPYLWTEGPVRPTGVFEPTPSSPTILEHSRLIFHEESGESSDSRESQRKYKSSMHLVLSLVLGLLILVSVLGVVARRVYDSWMRRHYRRMDFLIDGMYNGYG